MNVRDQLVLYVDDERTNRIVFEQSFGARFRVRTVASAEEALEVFKSEPVAVLLTDQRMPGMTGHDLLVSVKQQYPETVRVVITAYSDIDPILAAVNEGLVARYIVKPWDRAELEQLLQWGIEAFALGRESSELQLRLLQTERLATLGSIAAAMLHDLHQPLNNMTVNANRLQQLAQAATLVGAWARGEPVSLDEAQRAALVELASELPEIAGDLLASCRIMRDLSGDLRQFLRPDRSDKPAATDPLPVVRHALSVCQETAVRARGRLIYEGPTELPKIRIGSSELSQVLINLVANGAQALIARKERGGRVVVRVVVEPERLRFVISDDGPGMPPEILAKVGTPFFSTRAEGTGLGVAQCLRLVGRAGGELGISSTPGSGTTVTFTVPRA